MNNVYNNFRKNKILNTIFDVSFITYLLFDISNELTITYCNKSCLKNQFLYSSSFFITIATVAINKFFYENKQGIIKLNLKQRLILLFAVIAFLISSGEGYNYFFNKYLIYKIAYIALCPLFAALAVKGEFKFYDNRYLKLLLYIFFNLCVFALIICTIHVLVYDECKVVLKKRTNSFCIVYSFLIIVVANFSQRYFRERSSISSKK